MSEDFFAGIKVITEDANQNTLSQKCRVWTDVDYDTFDGNSATRIRVDTLGWYLLYHHNDKPIEIMTITEPGTSWGTIQCAISVKAGPDVFMIYLCKKSWIIRRLGCEHGNNLEVYEKQKGVKYLVILPTGTKVEILLSKTHYQEKWIFLNLNIYPSPDDIGKVYGMCENFDHHPDNGNQLKQQ